MICAYKTYVFFEGRFLQPRGWYGKVVQIGDRVWLRHNVRWESKGGKHAAFVYLREPRMGNRGRMLEHFTHVLLKARYSPALA